MTYQIILFLVTSYIYFIMSQLYFSYPWTQHVQIIIVLWPFLFITMNSLIRMQHFEDVIFSKYLSWTSHVHDPLMFIVLCTLLYITTFSFSNKFQKAQLKYLHLWSWGYNNMWCDQAKWVWSRKISNFIFWHLLFAYI